MAVLSFSRCDARASFGPMALRIEDNMQSSGGTGVISIPSKHTLLLLSKPSRLSNAVAYYNTFRGKTE